jgi:hypothetical protein
MQLGWYLMMPYGNVKVRPRCSLCEAQPKPSSDLLMQHIPRVPSLQHLHCLGLRMKTSLPTSCTFGRLSSSPNVNMPGSAVALLISSHKARPRVLLARMRNCCLSITDG